MTPALAAANNGNWQTASRWARMLAAHYRVRLATSWDGEPAAGMIALHARRSAEAIARWAAQQRGRPLVVVLTGTDLYRDIHQDLSARRSLGLATTLVTLHERAPMDLPAALRGKAVVCFQSCTARQSRAAGAMRPLHVLAVGHLRAEKDPETYFAAARLLARRPDIHCRHIGGALDAALGAQAGALAGEAGVHYQWLGDLPHEATRRHIQRAHVLVHASRMEGGAHVVMEAVRSGTPVLASRISGNVGMLGDDYEGYFEPGDAPGLVRLLERARDDAAMLPRLREQCALRAPLFDPARERACLLRILESAMTQCHDIHDRGR